MSLIEDARRGLIRAHSRVDCDGNACCVHAPSDHHMRDWPITFRFDKGALAERMCVHGVGHPDPDSVMYFLRQQGKRALYLWEHGCDGCCSPAGRD